MQTIHGVIHGKTIELSEAPPLDDGTMVEVVIRRSISPVEMSPSVAAVTAYQWTEQDDLLFAEIERERQQATFREISE